MIGNEALLQTQRVVPNSCQNSESITVLEETGYQLSKLAILFPRLSVHKLYEPLIFPRVPENKCTTWEPPIFSLACIAPQNDFKG